MVKGANETVAEKAKKQAGLKDKEDKEDKLVKAKTFIGSSRNEIQREIMKAAPAMSQILSNDIVARSVQMVTTIINLDERIRECSMGTILGAFVQSQLLGLDIAPQFGQFFFIPRKMKGVMVCTSMIGYKGFINLWCRSPEISHVYAHVRFEKDIWDYQLGLEPNLIHKPVDGDRGEAFGAYAVLKFSSGEKLFEYLNMEQIEARKKASDASDSKYSPWNQKDRVDMMRRKSAVRALTNFAPIRTDSMLGHALVTDEQALTIGSFDPKTKQITPEAIKMFDDVPMAEIVNEVPKDTPPTDPKKKGEPKKDTPPPSETNPPAADMKEKSGEETAIENDRLFLIEEVKAMKTKLIKVVGQQQALEIFKNQKTSKEKDLDRATFPELEQQLGSINYFLEAHEKGGGDHGNPQGTLL